MRILDAALRHVTSSHTPPDPAITLLGIPLAEDELRRGLERTYRMLGHRADDRDERIRLVDAANAVRPTTWT